MSRLFEELKRIAKEEFDCTLIKGTKKRTFSEVFGFKAKDVVIDNLKERLDNMFDGERKKTDE